MLQFWEFYRDPSSEQNSQKLLTLTQAPTSTTVSTKIGSTFRDWMLRKNRKSRTVLWLEDRFSLYMYTVRQNCGDVHVVLYLRIHSPRFTVLGALVVLVVLPKAVLLAVNIFLIDMLLGLSKWRLDSIQKDKSENYEHLRDGLLLHHRSVMLIFNFLPDLGRFPPFS